MQYESYIFDPRPTYPLVVTAKRYWHPEFRSEDPDALTLILTHGTGFHKEQWEPTLNDLFDAMHRDTGDRPKIHDIWSLDCPNHGDAAVLNEDELKWGYSRVFLWEEYARSVYLFLKGHGTGIPVDFSKRRLIPIAHSMGGVATVLCNTYGPPVDFSAIILVEPMIVYPPWITPESSLLEEGAAKRRDIWPNRDAAYETLRSRPAFKIWDPRVVRTLTDHGLRDLPTSLYPDQQGVTLKCTKYQEEASYKDLLGRARAHKYLSTLCSQFPVHFIQGAMVDPFIPFDVKDYIVNVVAGGKGLSLQRIEGAGHLIVQMQPTRLANAIYTDLKQEMKRPYTKNALTSSMSSRL